MKALGHGYILQTASIGAFQPCPLYASYGAAKAFVLNYGLAVRIELENQKLSWFQKTTMMTSGKVVEKALKALFKGRALYVPGIINKMNAQATRLIPRMLMR